MAKRVLVTGSSAALAGRSCGWLRMALKLRCTAARTWRWPRRQRARLTRGAGKQQCCSLTFLIETNARRCSRLRSRITAAFMAWSVTRA